MLGKMFELIHKLADKAENGAVMSWAQLLAEVQQAERSHREKGLFEKVHRLLPWDEIWKKCKSGRRKAQRKDKLTFTMKPSDILVDDDDDNKELSQVECRTATKEALMDMRRFLPTLVEYLAPMVLKITKPPGLKSQRACI